MRKNLGRFGSLLVVLLFLGLFLTLFLVKKEDSTVVEHTVATSESSTEVSDKEKVVSQYLSQMTLEEKVGQMIFARMPSTGQAEMLENYDFGGYILFASDFEGKTLEQVKEEIASYQSLSNCITLGIVPSWRH